MYKVGIVWNLSTLLKACFEDKASVERGAFEERYTAVSLVVFLRPQDTGYVAKSVGE